MEGERYVWTIRDTGYLRRFGSVSYLATAVSQSPTHSVEAIQKVWTERQEKARSFRFEWTCKRTIPKGLFDAVPGVAKAGQPPSPPTDIIADGRRRLIVEAKRFRYELTGDNWSQRDRALKPSAMIYSLNGDRYTDYLETSPSSEYGTAHISKLDNTQRAAILDSMALIPILLTYRSMDPAFHQLALDDYELTGRSAVVNAVVHRTPPQTAIGRPTRLPAPRSRTGVSDHPPVHGGEGSRDFHSRCDIHLRSASRLGSGTMGICHSVRREDTDRVESVRDDGL